MLNDNINKIIAKFKFFLLFPYIARDYFNFKGKLIKNRGFKMSWFNLQPIINEKSLSTSFDRHYIYHPAWAARIIAQNKPEEHIDISSILSFSSIISAFVPVCFFDYRPADIELSNLSCGHADLLNLPFKDNSVKSLSCMHTVEHIGLGRYGDPLDPDGDLKAMKELSRVLAPGGSLLFVVPVGRPKIYFNAHRIYSYQQVVSSFDGLILKEFSLISEKNGGLVVNATENNVAKEKYACGCFWFTKLK